MMHIHTAGHKVFEEMGLKLICLIEIQSMLANSYLHFKKKKKNHEKTNTGGNLILLQVRKPVREYLSCHHTDKLYC